MSNYQQRRQQVQNLLSGLNYKEKSAVEIQILQLLHQIHSLRPLVDNYVFNDGTQQQLFKLEGTIPIQYRSSQYNIPVALWLPLNFPTNCPICYVTPVAGMKIKQKHMHVDSQGLIYHPYLHSWKPGQSTLVELIGLLCSVFGKDPPLYASKKASQPPPPQQQQQQIYRPPPNVVSPPIVQQQPKPQPPPPEQPPPSQVPKAEEKKDNNKEILEKELRSYLQKIYDKENEQLNALASAQKQLENHTKTINDIREKQKNEKDLLLQRRQNLQIKIEATEQWLSQNENNDEIDINSIIIASDTWSEQCIEASSMDFAITDVMLELDRCLEDETIKLETYLKQISKMAREQFAHKALAKAVFKKQNNLVLLNQQHR